MNSVTKVHCIQTQVKEWFEYDAACTHEVSVFFFCYARQHVLHIKSMIFLP